MQFTRVEHRHDDQKKDEPNLVLEVGKPVPPFYQRQPGLVVTSIEAGDPVRCTLSDGDIIPIGKRHVRSTSPAKD